MRWAGACDSFRGKRDVNRVFVGKPEGQYYVEDIGISASIIFKWIIKK
jgi:hypothetical protein